MNNVFDLDRIGRTFEINNDGMLPKYVKRFTSPMSADAEISFECDINASLFAKLTGVDLAQGRDATCASVIFQKPYQVQRRHHKKKRIQKKWIKRYGWRVQSYKKEKLNNVMFTECGDGSFTFKTV